VSAFAGEGKACVSDERKTSVSAERALSVGYPAFDVVGREFFMERFDSAGECA
jgi:hypothetical protein